jgi:outer membrane protein assembly factor BamB
LNLADVGARLVLTSIREGSFARARIELVDFMARHPGAKGRIAGRDADYAETLGKLLDAAEHENVSGFRSTASGASWPTFAGSTRRTAIAAGRGSFGAKIWEAPLVADEGFQADVNLFGRGLFARQLRVAEDAGAPGLLSFHPVVNGDLVLFNRIDRIFALNIKTGQPAWPTPNAADREPGEIYRGSTSHEMPTDRNAGGTLYHAWGAPRFTMTVFNNRLYARLGSPITSHPRDEQFVGESSYLVCLDLAAQGYLRWRTANSGKDDDQWAFEGSPVCDGSNVYLAMRYSDVRPQEHVACFDAQTGAMRWRRLVCAAETPAQGQVEEITSNLLTLADGMIYINTNLGAVAAMRASDGRLLWLTRYPRAKLLTSADQSHLYRDLNPCVYDRGNLYVAPTDAQGIFSFDASTGRLLWESTGAHDAVHLLGVAEGYLIASGRRIYWLNADGGKEIHAFPDQLTVQGYGRGALVGDLVYWPTRNDIRFFPQAIRAERKREVPDPAPVAGGNIIVAGDYLLIATPKKLIAYAVKTTGAKSDDQPLMTQTHGTQHVGFTRP